MPDDDLKAYIPLYGDRIAAMAYSRSKQAQDNQGDTVEPGPTGSCLRRLQNKLSLRKKRSAHSSLCGPSTADRPANKHKATRRVEIGWMNFERNTESYKQVRSQNGGGTRHLDVQKDIGVEDLLPLGINLFFPNGVSQKGKMDDFSFKLNDFRMTEFGSRTVSEIYEESRVKILRVYVCSHLKDVPESPDVPPTSTSVTPNDTCPEPSVSLPDFDLDDTLPDLPAVADDLNMSTDGANVPDEDTGTPTVTFNLRPRLVLRKPVKLTPQETIMDILLRLEQKIDISMKNIINVDRSNVLDGGFRGLSRATFDPWRKLSVRFVEEDAIDDGGPMREFLRLAVTSAKDLPIFSGGDEKKSLSLDYNAMNKNTYYKTGQLFAYSIIHRGPTPCFFSDLLFSMLTEEADEVVPVLDDIDDYDVKKQVSEIRECRTPNSYQVATEKSTDIISLAGCTNLAIRFSEERRNELVKSLIKFLAVDRVRPAIDQFKRGLQSMGLIDEMKANPESWKEVFLSPTNKTLDAAQLDALFTIKWSEAESNRRAQERRVVSCWRDLLEDLADGVAGPITGRVITLADVLVFATGAQSIPHLGFNPDPTISFLHPEHVEYEFLRGMPKSNTCAMELKLPISSDFDEFKSNVLASLEMATTFTTH